jgi:hypothetical protein
MTFAVAQELNTGHTVMVIDFEDNERTLVRRLRALAVPDVVIAAQVIYIRPQEPVTDDIVGSLVELIDQYNVTLVGVDSVGEALAVEGKNEDRDNEVGPWLRTLPRILADAGPAVVLVDHSTKTADNPLHASGSKRKRAAISGASYLVDAVRPLVKSDGHDPAEGRLKLTCAKDRHGNYARGEVVATFALTSYPDEGVTGHLWPVEAKDRHVDVAGILAARAATKAAKEAGGRLIQGALIGLMQIKASAVMKRSGIDIAVMKGALSEEPGPHSARYFTWRSDLPEES